MFEKGEMIVKRLIYVFLTLFLICSLMSCEKNKSDESNWKPTTSDVGVETEQTDSIEKDESIETEESMEEENTTTSKEDHTDFWSKVY